MRGPEPDTGINLVCRCGAWMPIGRHRTFWPHGHIRTAWDAALFRKDHHGPGHLLDRDDYRAPCRPAGGCRNCGAQPVWPKRFYCSDACRVEFDADHFWGSARHRADWRQSVYDIETRDRVGTVCARCGLTGRGALEVNHIQPVNGERYHFGCSHHLSNLEALCHACHLIVTAEQRAAGLIRTM